jgi:hypothetical protein
VDRSVGLFCGVAKNAKWNKSRQGVEGPGLKIIMLSMVIKLELVQLENMISVPELLSKMVGNLLIEIDILINRESVITTPILVYLQQQVKQVKHLLY